MKRLNDLIADAAGVAVWVAIPVILMVLLMLIPGCKDSLPTEAGKSVQKADQPKIASPTSYFFTNKVYPVMKRDCWGCHAVQSPGGMGYPAGVQISLTGGPGNSSITLPDGMSGDDMVVAVAKDMAPLNHPLTAGARDTLMEYFITTLGLSGSQQTVPGTFSWSQATHQTGFSYPVSGYRSGGYHSFAVENIAARANLQLESYTESSQRCCNQQTNPSNDRSSPITANALWMSFYETTYIDSFSSSDDGTFYISPAGVAWNSRLKGNRMYKGYVQIANRWFIAVDVQEDRRGFSTGGRRNAREYMRFQIEGNADRDIGWRYKHLGFTDELETVQAWGGSPGPSGAQDEGAGMLSELSENLWDNTFYWVEVEVTYSGGDTHYEGRVYDKEGGTLLGEAGAIRENVEAFGGFAWGWYQRQSAGKYNRMTGWTVTASDMFGAGTGQGTGCHTCELEPPVRVSGPRIGKRAVEPLEEVPGGKGQ